MKSSVFTLCIGILILGLPAGVPPKMALTRMSVTQVASRSADRLVEIANWFDAATSVTQARVDQLAHGDPTDVFFVDRLTCGLGHAVFYSNMARRLDRVAYESRAVGLATCEKDGSRAVKDLLLDLKVEIEVGELALPVLQRPKSEGLDSILENQDHIAMNMWAEALDVMRETRQALEESEIDTPVHSEGR